MSSVIKFSFAKNEEIVSRTKKCTHRNWGEMFSLRCDRKTKWLNEFDFENVNIEYFADIWQKECCFIRTSEPTQKSMLEWKKVRRVSKQ